MKSLKLKLLGSALLLAAGTTGTAHAADIYGGGATLPAPALSQAFNCYAGNADYLVRNSTGDLVDTAEKACPAGVTSPVNKNNVYHAAATGSGIGIAAYFSHDASRYGNYPATPFASVEYGLSDNALKQSDVDAWNNGGTVQGVTVVAPGATPTGSQYANPFEQYGNLIQVPNVIAAVGIAYKVPAGVTIGTTSGKLELTKKNVCDIFLGNVTYWDQLPSVTGHVRIIRVGRQDSSGTTSLFTRFMASACAGVTRNKFTNPAGTSTLPVTSGWRLGTGSSGVATLLDTTKGAIGYLGSEYLVSSSLQSASLQEGTGSTYLQPTAANATAAFNSLGFTAPADAAQQNPLNWVPTNLNSAVANPPAGYPIIGTSNTLFYGCYASTAKVNALISPSTSAQGFFRWYYTNAAVVGTSGILAQNGVAPLPSAFRTAIYNFLRANMKVKGATGCTNKGA